MKVTKGEVLTVRLRVDDPEAAQALLGPLMNTILTPRGPAWGCVVTASARGDVFAERDSALAGCGCPCCDCTCVTCDPENDEEQDDGANA